MKRWIVWLSLILLLFPALSGDAAQHQAVEIVLTKDKPVKTSMFVLDSSVPGPTLVFVAGVHGNEYAGYHAAWHLLEYIHIKTGRIAIIPEANAMAVRNKARTAQDGLDLNRLFPGKEDGNDIQALAKQIVDQIVDLKPVAVVDMHEGRNLYGIDGSIGNSIVIGSTPGSFVAALDVLESVNEQIGELTPFTFDTNAPEGSLNYHMSVKVGIDAFTIETPQIYDLETRISLQLSFVRAILAHYGIASELAPSPGITAW